MRDFLKRFSSINQERLVFFFIFFSLLPFINKPFHIDDPFWVWTANQILKSPLNFYGYEQNWFGSFQAMSTITKTPPLFAYGLSLWGKIFGFSEGAFHLFCFLVAGLTGVGVFKLSSFYRTDRLLSTILSVSTPFFLLAGSVVMCDMLMFCFDVWAVVLWLKAEKNFSHALFFTAALFAGLSTLTKYNGAFVVPLMFFYSWRVHSKLKKQVLYLSIPFIFLFLYQFLTKFLYGEGHLGSVAAFSVSRLLLDFHPLMRRFVTALVFTGAGVAPFLLVKSLFSGVRSALIFIGSVIVGFFLFSLLPQIGPFVIKTTEGIQWVFLVQFSLWLCCGIYFMGSAFLKVFKSRTPETELMVGWIFITFIFSFAMNWAVTSRALLPLCAFAGILLFSEEENASTNIPIKNSILIGFTLILSFIVGHADLTWASLVKEGAFRVMSDSAVQNKKVYFQGHWGFQYYMESFGAEAFDIDKPQTKKGDILVLPFYNTNVRPMNSDSFSLVKKIRLVNKSSISLMRKETGAGFYADVWGPLPFAWGKRTSEDFLLLEAK